MKNNSLLAKLQATQKHLREPKLRRRLQLFHRALTVGNITQACREFGTSPQLYHYWWRRFQKANYSREALKEKSRRPKNSPRKTSEKITRWICAYRKKFGHTAEKIRRLLEQEKNITVSLPTVYRVLSREGLGRPRKSSRPRAEVSELPASEQAPKKIAGRYRVLRILGSGGGGVVYLVEDSKMEGAKLALKLLEVRKETDPALMGRLKNEFIALAALHHPHTARVYDFGITAEQIFFTSEYIPGRDILTAAQGAHLNLIFQWIVQILSALDFLHRKGILHLDLKPMNILVTDPDAAGEVSAKLIDFGSADCRKAGQAASGEVMGTPPYVAPELLLERAPSAAADLYSLGILLHQIFFGAFPFREQEPFRRMQEQIYQEPLRLKGLPPSLPEAFAELLYKMVAREPRDRFASAREVLEAINQSLGENFSLRSERAPVRILEESEHLFHAREAEELVGLASGGRPQLAVVSGSSGIGKSRLLQRVKELLQLSGVFPLLFPEAGALERYLRSGEKILATPILVDGVKPEELGRILEGLDEAGATAIVATRQPPSLEVFAHRWVELKPLTDEAVLKFFQSSLAGFPQIESSHPLVKLTAGNPKKLEELLQSLQEEGALQWTDRGWQWRDGLELDFPNLLRSHERRWEERRIRVAEILQISPVGFSAPTLAGVLGLEAGSLEAKLSEWKEEGSFKSKKLKKVVHYFLRRSEPPEKASTAIKEEKWQEELETLYRQGEFESGSRFADLLLSKATQGKLSPSIAVACARHYAADGEAAKALAALPSDSNTGLCYEIRARARFTLGNFSEALEDLQGSEGEYQKKKDLAGLSRVSNLRGSIFKKLSEFSQAKSHFQTAIEQAAAAGDAYLQGLAQMNLAIFYHEQGEFERAYSTYEAAMRLEDQARHPLLSSRLRLNWLNLIFFMGRAPEAERSCYELLKLSLKHHYVDLQASALNFLALIAGQKNHHELQLNFLNQALSLLKSRQLWFPYTQTLLNRASFYWEQNRFTPAELDAQFALDLAKRRKNPLFTAWAQLYLGRILRDRLRPDWIEAEEFLARARQGIWRAKNQPLYWEVEFDRGLLAKKKGEFSQAREFFRSAQGQLEELLAKVPDFVKQSYLRDRKMERIEAELSSVGSKGLFSPAEWQG